MSIDTPEQAKAEFRSDVKKARMARKMTRKLPNKSPAKQKAKKMTRELEDLYGYSQENPNG